MLDYLIIISLLLNFKMPLKNIEKNINFYKKPVKISFYKNNLKETEVKGNFKGYSDIGVYSVIFSDKDYLKPNTYKDNFNYYYNLNENIKGYKIGYNLKFTGEKEINQNIFGPSDKEILEPYMAIFLYDDINNKTSFYSHLEEKDINDNTLMTSIKLYGGKTELIKSDIKLAVFIYKDKSNLYNISTLTIKRN